MQINYVYTSNPHTLRLSFQFATDTLLFFNRTSFII